MWCLDEPTARQVNREGQCMRTFWESPFEFKPLDNEEALRSCMSYLDFNPVRSAMAEIPSNQTTRASKSALLRSSIWPKPFAARPSSRH